MIFKRKPPPPPPPRPPVPNNVPEIGEFGLARILHHYRLIIPGFTYQGTARILLREYRAYEASFPPYKGKRV